MDESTSAPATGSTVLQSEVCEFFVPGTGYLAAGVRAFRIAQRQNCALLFLMNGFYRVEMPSRGEHNDSRGDFRAQSGSFTIRAFTTISAAWTVAHRSRQAILPASAVLTKELKLDFENDGKPDIIMAYAVKQDDHLFNAGVRILRYSSVPGWTVAFEETHASVTNGGGPSDVITVKEITSLSGQHGTVVILRTSGAGTATDWYLLSSTKHKISKLEPGPLRAKVLAKRGYQDWGYNDVKSNHDLVVETQPGFSRTTARCCPDRPPIEMTFRFTGSSITLDSVKDLPFTRPTQ
jgi:hypothetical protein